MKSVITPAALRGELLDLIIGSSLITQAEKLRANHNAHECQDAARLTRWLRNTRAELARREAVKAAPLSATMPTYFALGVVPQGPRPACMRRFYWNGRTQPTMRIRQAHPGEPFHLTYCLN